MSTDPQSRAAALLRRVEAPEWVDAVEAVSGDPILAARLQAARAGGMAPPVLDVPRHRRAAELEQALDLHDTLTRGGPCSYCGCTLARRAPYGPGSPLNSHLEPAHFTTAGSPALPACQWCAATIARNGADYLATWAYAVAVGLKSATPDAVLFAHETDELPPHPRTPWSYLPLEALRAEAVTLHPGVAFDPRPRSAIPGLAAPAERLVSLVPSSTVWHDAEAAEREAAEREAWEARQARDKAKEQAYADRAKAARDKRDQLAIDDPKAFARLAAMPELGVPPHLRSRSSFPTPPPAPAPAKPAPVVLPEPVRKFRDAYKRLDKLKAQAAAATPEAIRAAEREVNALVEPAKNAMPRKRVDLSKIPQR